MNSDKKVIIDGQDEILYVVNKRSKFFLIFGDFLFCVLGGFLSYVLFFSQNILFILLGIIILLYVLYILLNTLTFHKLILYRDRVEIVRKFLEISTISMDDIKCVKEYGSMGLACLYFTSKKDWFSRFKYCVTGLYIKDVCEIQKIIQNLIKKDK